jgi:predicted DNA-binding ribbon-helix-helix protein
MATTLPRPSGRNREAGSSSLVIRNIVVGGRRTSVRLEPTMWEALHDIAHCRNASVHDLVTEIDSARSASTLTAAIRVYIVNFYRSAAQQAGRVAPLPLHGAAC